MFILHLSKFELRTTNCSTCFGNKLLLSFVIILPVSEKILSHGVDEL